MKQLLLAGLAASALSLVALTPAEASGGCGPYGHRGWDGYCRPNARPLPFYPAYGRPYGWHRPHGYGGYGYGWHRPWGGPRW